jgi:large subunit ribosomal protein L1
MAKLGKRTRAAREAFEGKENLKLEEAVKLVKGAPRPSSTRPSRSR